MNMNTKELDLGPLAYFSHELRTPLNAILGYADLMIKQANGPIPDQYHGFLEGIHTSGQHLLAMVNNILDYSKIQAGEMPLHPQSVDLEALINTCLNMISGLASDKRIQLNFSPEEELPTLCIDETLIRQVFLNLLSNAIKFSPKETVITIRLSADRFEISDQGVGMDHQDIAEAMRPYGQAINDGKTRHEGTGLGLSLVKAILDMHKAKLKFESEKGKGTAVSVVFPESCIEA